MLSVIICLGSSFLLGFLVYTPKLLDWLDYMQGGSEVGLEERRQPDKLETIEEEGEETPMLQRSSVLEVVATKKPEHWWRITQRRHA